MTAFQVCPEDDLEHPIKKDSPSGAWKEVLERINARKPQTEKRAVCSVSGPDYFGYVHPIAVKLIEELPNADKCPKYKMKNWTSTKPTKLKQATLEVNSGKEKKQTNEETGESSE